MFNSFTTIPRFILLRPRGHAFSAADGVISTRRGGGGKATRILGMFAHCCQPDSRSMTGAPTTAPGNPPSSPIQASPMMGVSRSTSASGTEPLDTGSAESRQRCGVCITGRYIICRLPILASSRVLSSQCLIFPTIGDTIFPRSQTSKWFPVDIAATQAPIPLLFRRHLISEVFVSTFVRHVLSSQVDRLRSERNSAHPQVVGLISSPVS